MFYVCVVFNQKVVECIDVVQLYINVVWEVYGLLLFKWKVGELYFSDVDFLIKNLIEVLCEGLVLVVLFIVNFCDVVKEYVKDDFDWDVVLC